jgi:hypothetical protein
MYEFAGVGDIGEDEDSIEAETRAGDMFSEHRMRNKAAGDYMDQAQDRGELIAQLQSLRSIPRGKGITELEFDS